jgi:hypothetical protein
MTMKTGSTTGIPRGVLAATPDTAPSGGDGLRLPPLTQLASVSLALTPDAPNFALGVRFSTLFEV